ncbi:PREDICTED: uncharacterized protein C1orf94 homolog [Elephantulus edwardii]|uniref:uncharacterized protein C1orf94 homolog n=1 Tax=Elephantulus edwardii TaxID=28737 RepID=UPI0003F073A7|nr:PREDICTED: uncharacterized protein C1orf94 homolog [Elephantulus edwardii]
MGRAPDRHSHCLAPGSCLTTHCLSPPRESAQGPFRAPAHPPQRAEGGGYRAQGAPRTQPLRDLASVRQGAGSPAAESAPRPDLPAQVFFLGSSRIATGEGGRPGGQRCFCRERRSMASGNGLPSASALVAKRPSALGPFPRYIWIHHDTPQDSLDKTCHEIWKRVQGLPEALKPRTWAEQLSASAAVTSRDNQLAFQEEALELSSDKDEISLLVEQEFLSLNQENLILVKESSIELESPRGSPEGKGEPTPCILGPPPLLEADSIELPGVSITNSDQLLEQKVAMPVIGSRQNCDSALSTVTGILRSAKVKSTKGSEDGGSSLGTSNLEISKLLAQFPLKSTETKASENKLVLEETKVIKDFLQNSVFSDSGPKEPAGLGPFLMLPPPPPLAPLDKLSELPTQKRQLPVFAKICSKPEVDSALEGQHLIERNPGTKELTKGRESLFLSQCPQSLKDSCGEEGCSDPGGTMSMALPTKKSAWPAEKNLLYEFLGTTKNTSRPLRLRSKMDMDGLELKLNPPVTVAEKNSKYTGNVFTPRFAPALTSAALNQPFWLNLNYPPPPMFTNQSTFPQYQGMYPQRTARMPYQQAVHPQLGCYSRQVSPYNPQQMGQQVFRSSYPPMLSYIPFVQPNYPYTQRTPPKMSTNPRDPSPMAGDGPQYLFPQGYGFNSTAGGPVMNSPYFSSRGNGVNF